MEKAQSFAVTSFDQEGFEKLFINEEIGNLYNKLNNSINETWLFLTVNRIMNAH